MGFLNQGARSNETALASATSADGVARNGATITMQKVALGTPVAAHCVVTIVTGSVVCTVKWQYSLDGSTFYDLRDANNTAQTTITATATRGIQAPAALSNFPYGRVVMTLSGASTAAGDLTAATYYYLRFGETE